MEIDGHARAPQHGDHSPHGHGTSGAARARARDDEAAADAAVAVTGLTPAADPGTHSSPEPSGTAAATAPDRDDDGGGEECKGDGDDAEGGSAPSARERHALTLAQRRSLRRWAQTQPARPSHRACIDWFAAEYGMTISQSTVSHSLGQKYARLDADRGLLSGARLRYGNWPDVEKVVLLWLQQMQVAGRHPTNDEIAEKARLVFQRLPRYRDEKPPEFSAGWIHRFKKRYGLISRRNRRHGEAVASVSDDVPYLSELAPRFVAVSARTSPAAIKESLLRVFGIESSLHTCALVRDEVLRRGTVPSLAADADADADEGTGTTESHAGLVPDPVDHLAGPSHSQSAAHPVYLYDDPVAQANLVLADAIEMMRQEQQEAEAAAAAAARRGDQERAEHDDDLPPHEPTADGMLATPAFHHRAARFSADPAVASELALTPLHADVSVADGEKPVRCPFCLNHRMLRTVKEAVAHMSTHITV